MAVQFPLFLHRNQSIHQSAFSLNFPVSNTTKLFPFSYPFRGFISPHQTNWWRGKQTPWKVTIITYGWNILLVILWNLLRSDMNIRVNVVWTQKATNKWHYTLSNGQMFSWEGNKQVRSTENSFPGKEMWQIFKGKLEFGCSALAVRGCLSCLSVSGKKGLLCLILLWS